jgi:hypothetical protein
LAGDERDDQRTGDGLDLYGAFAKRAKAAREVAKIRLTDLLDVERSVLVTVSA